MLLDWRCGNCSFFFVSCLLLLFPLINSGTCRHIAGRQCKITGLTKIIWHDVVVPDIFKRITIQHLDQTLRIYSYKQVSVQTTSLSSYIIVAAGVFGRACVTDKTEEMTLFTVFLLWENTGGSRLRFLCLGTIGIDLSQAAVTDLSLSPWQSHIEKRKQKFIAQNYWQRTLMSIFIVINLYRGSLNRVCVIVVGHWSVFWYERGDFFMLTAGVRQSGKKIHVKRLRSDTVA